MSERDDNQILVGMRRIAGSLDGGGLVQPTFPRLEPCQTIGRRRGTLVRDVVGHARVGVHRGNVRTHAGRQQPRCHGKVLVVRTRQRLARGVGARQRLGPEGHCRILVRYA